VKEKAVMLDLVLVGGIVVALAGVLQSTTWRRRRGASPVSLLQEGMGGFEGADAEAVRAEFRRSGVALPPHRPPAGFC
jgi:hypothetical protein